MKYIDIVLPLETIETLFPCNSEEDTVVQVSPEAVTIAAALAGTWKVQWHLPDAFNVRYGSSYVATAFAGDTAVRFHSDEGIFREGDDK